MWSNGLGLRMADYQLLGDVPLVTEIQRAADSGEPVSAHVQANESALLYRVLQNRHCFNKNTRTPKEIRPSKIFSYLPN